MIKPSSTATTARTPTARVQSSTASVRGYRVRDFCEREGITRSTFWRWSQKGVVVVSRLDRAVGVRVVYANPTFDDQE